MKLKIKKDQLLVGLNTVCGVVSMTTAFPILSNVLMKADKGKLVLTATDLDVTVECAVDAAIENKGAATVSAKRILGVVKDMVGAEIELEVDDKHACAVRCGRSAYRILGLPADDYPPAPILKGAATVVLPQKGLKGMLTVTLFAMSTDTARFTLNGVLLIPGDKSLTAVGSDGRRLALASHDVNVKGKEGAQFIVPAKAVGELVRLLKDDGDTSVSVTDNYAQFALIGTTGAEAMLTTKLIEGSYPNYKQVIPSECKERITVPRVELLRALRAAGTMTTDKFSALKLSFEKNELAITANSPDAGDAKEVIDLKYKGSPVAFAVNPKYLCEPLAALEDDEVFIELIDELSPVVVKVNGPFLYVVMPLRLS